MTLALIAAAVVLAFLAGVVIYDVYVQRAHAILHNYPIVGHFRYILESVGPELRQYIVTGNDEERPFSRDQRRWVYASAKVQNSYFGFGTDNDLERTPGYIVIRHATFPHADVHYPGPYEALPCAKVLGGRRGRAKAFRPTSLVNTSAMSYGSLSAAAVRSINEGVKLAGAMQNTGEGGLSPHHAHGGELIWQIGTGYFGCRTKDGKFDLEMLKERVARFPVRAIEIKLSQGAKPGKGGVLPASKVTPEIAEIRGVPLGVDVISPAGHAAFTDADSLLDFVERIAEATGLPVGIKSAVGEMAFWDDLSRLMARGDRGVDHIQIDGGEGGTGAAPLVFTDHVSLPFKLGFSQVYRRFAAQGVANDLVWIGSGKLGFPENALLAFALGCDAVAVAREAMLAIGCIQAQKCHTGRCPTGVATNDPWLMAGLDPALKSVRLANYLAALRHELLSLAIACGEPHPALVDLDRIEILDGGFGSRPAREVFGYEPGWGQISAEQAAAVRGLAVAR